MTRDISTNRRLHLVSFLPVHTVSVSEGSANSNALLYSHPCFPNMCRVCGFDCIRICVRSYVACRVIILFSSFRMLFER